MWAPVLLFSIVAHEYAHAEAAYRQGDDTAYMLGRLTLNPLKHIDPFMTVVFPVILFVASNGTFTFGAAKPVPVTPRKYRNFRRGDIIVSLAGIVTNLALFVVAAALFAGVGLVGGALPSLLGSWEVVQRMLFYGMWMNLPLEAATKYRQLYGLGYAPIIAFLVFVRLVPAARGIYLWPVQQLMHGALTLVGRFGVSPGVFSQ